MPTFHLSFQRLHPAAMSWLISSWGHSTALHSITVTKIANGLSNSSPPPNKYRLTPTNKKVRTGTNFSRSRRTLYIFHLENIRIFSLGDAAHQTGKLIQKLFGIHPRAGHEATRVHHAYCGSGRSILTAQTSTLIGAKTGINIDGCSISISRHTKTAFAVSADKSASQSRPVAALPTNSSASRQYTRSISIDLCRV
jgi:hypothetical protein